MRLTYQIIVLAIIIAAGWSAHALAHFIVHSLGIEAGFVALVVVLASSQLSYLD